MDKETLSNYGWIVICVLVMVVMIALATPFGSFISEAVQSTTKGLFDVNKTALESTGFLKDIIPDQDFNVPSTAPEQPDDWDGTANTSWYNDTDTEFILSTAEDLAGFAVLVDNGNTFAGKTVKLGCDINLKGYTWNSIGTSAKTFNGTFDGQGKTIYNMTQDSRAAGTDGARGGLFDTINAATIKNLKINGFYVTGLTYSKESILGSVATVAKGNCTMDNISIANTTLLQNNAYSGGLVGQINGGTHTYNNINIAESVKICSAKAYNSSRQIVAPIDTALGGVTAYASCTALNLTNSNIACTIDAYADIIGANHVADAYRYCGMIVGYSSTRQLVSGKLYVATANYLHCENVTVTYGKWADYTYCEFKDKTIFNSDEYPTYGMPYPYSINGTTYQDKNGYAEGNTYWEYIRVQDGIDIHGIGKVEHTHNEGEDHERSLPFDQLIGTGDTNGTTANRGNPEHPGVTVIRNY